jgi:ferritin-like protein
MATAPITIEVDEESARVFAQASTEEQRKMQLLLSLRLRELVTKPGKRLQELMDEIGAEAEARGLTPEILDSILNVREQHS